MPVSPAAWTVLLANEAITWTAGADPGQAKMGTGGVPSGTLTFDATLSGYAGLGTGGNIGSLAGNWANFTGSVTANQPAILDADTQISGLAFASAGWTLFNTATAGGPHTLTIGGQPAVSGV